jgi:hypothetical protein
MSKLERDFDLLVEIMNNIITSSAAKDEKRLLNSISNARYWLRDWDLLATKDTIPNRKVKEEKSNV